LSQPRKKMKMKMKIALGPTCQPPPLSLSLFLPRRGTRRRRPTPTRAGHPRPPCHARPPLALILPRGRVPLFLLFLLAHEPSRAARRHPRLPRRRRFLASGRSPLDSSRGELPLTLLLRFRSLSGLGPRCAGPPPLSSVRRRPSPWRRRLAAAPRLRHRR